MGQDPDRIRREIEETRERMTDTVEAIGYRADVKTRAKESIVEKKDAVVDKATGLVNRVVGAMPDVHAPALPDLSMPGFVPDGNQVRHGADQVKGSAKEAVSVAQANPLGLAVGSIAVGFLAGMLVPSTRTEDERLGKLSDHVKQNAREAGQDALEHGKQVAQETIQSATETAKETVQTSGQVHGQELADSLKTSAQEMKAGPSLGS